MTFREFVLDGKRRGKTKEEVLQKANEYRNRFGAFDDDVTPDYSDEDLKNVIALPNSTDAKDEDFDTQKVRQFHKMRDRLDMQDEEAALFISDNYGNSKQAVKDISDVYNLEPKGTPAEVKSQPFYDDTNDSWFTAIRKGVQNAGYQIGEAIGGLTRYWGEEDERFEQNVISAVDELRGVEPEAKGWFGKLMDNKLGDLIQNGQALYHLAQYEKRSPGKFTLAAQKAMLERNWDEAARLFETGEGFKMDKMPEWFSEMTDSMHESVTEAGETIGDYWSRKAKENAIHATKYTPKWIVAKSLESTLGTLVPAFAITAVTKNPTLGAAYMFPQVFGQTYGQSRSDGLNVKEAQQQAFVQAIIESLSEEIPLGILTKKGGRFGMRVLKEATAESAQEVVGEMVNIGYDTGILGKDVTWKDAVTRIFDSGLLGFFGGLGAGGISETGVALADKINPETNGANAEGSKGEAARGDDGILRDADGNILQNQQDGTYLLTPENTGTLDKKSTIVMNRRMTKPDVAAIVNKYGEDRIHDIYGDEDASLILKASAGDTQALLDLNQKIIGDEGAPVSKITIDDKPIGAIEESPIFITDLQPIQDLEQESNPEASSIPETSAEKTPMVNIGDKAPKSELTEQPVGHNGETIEAMDSSKTKEFLDNLPVGSLVASRMGDVFIKLSDGTFIHDPSIKREGNSSTQQRDAGPSNLGGAEVIRVGKTTPPSKAPDAVTVALRHREIDAIAENIGIQPKDIHTTEAAVFNNMESQGLVERSLDIAKSVNKSKREISGEEHVAFVVKSEQIKRELNQINDQIENNIKHGEPTEELYARKHDLESTLSEVVMADRIGGTMSAQNLRFRKIKLDLAYDEAGVLQRMMLYKKEPLTEKEKFKGREKAKAAQEADQAVEDATTEELKQNTRRVVQKVRKKKIKPLTDEEANAIMADIEQDIRDGGLTAESAANIRKLAIDKIVKGVTTIEAMADEVIADVPSLMEKDVYDSMGGRIVDEKATKTKLQKRIQRMKRESKYAGRVMDAFDGLLDAIKRKVVDTPYIEKAQIQLKLLEADIRKNETDPLRRKRLLAQIKKQRAMLEGQHRDIKPVKKNVQKDIEALDKELRDLQSQIRTTDQIAEYEKQLREWKRPDVEQTPEEISDALAELRERLSQVRGDVGRFIEPKTESEAKRIDRINKQIDKIARQNELLYRDIPMLKPGSTEAIETAKAQLHEQLQIRSLTDRLAKYEEALRTRNFEELMPKEKAYKKDSKEVLALQYKARKAKAEVDLYISDLNKGKLEKIGGEIFNIPRSILLSLDSPLLRQGAMVLSDLSQFMRNIKIIGQTLGSYVSEDMAGSVSQAMRNDPLFMDLIMDGVHITDETFETQDGERRVGRSLIHRVPWVGKAFKGADRSQAMGINLVRFGRYKQFRESAPNASIPARQIMAKWINIMSGRSEIKNVSMAVPILDKIFISTRFALSRIQAPVYIVEALRKKEYYVAGQIAKDWFWFIGMRIAMMKMLAIAYPDKFKIDWDLTKSTFGKLQVQTEAGTRVYDPWAGYGQTTRLMLALPQDIVAGLTNGNPMNPLTTLEKFAEYRLNPVITAVSSQAVGEDVFGIKRPRKELARRSFTPLILDNVWESIQKESGGADITTSALFDLLGVNSYLADPNTRYSRENRRNVR